MFIYISKEESLSVCLSVRYAFEDRTSKCYETFQKWSLHSEEGRHVFFSEKKRILRMIQAIYETDQ